MSDIVLKKNTKAGEENTGVGRGVNRRSWGGFQPRMKEAERVTYVGSVRRGYQKSQSFPNPLQHLKRQSVNEWSEGVGEKPQEGSPVGEGEKANEYDKAGIIQESGREVFLYFRRSDQAR